MKVKIKIDFLYRYSTMWALIVAFVALFFLALYIYHNIYRTVTETTIIINLQTETAIVEPLDLGSWNRIKEYLKEKDDILRPDSIKLKNPFIKVGPTT